MTTRALALAIVVATTPATFDALPTSGASAENFVPSGWVVEARHEGDLTGDSVSDLVLILVKRKGEEPGSRALVVLARERGRFTLLGHNISLLMCDGCGGVRGGTGAPTISIEKGVLNVSQGNGSSESYSSSVHRFWLDRGSRGLVLIGVDREFHDEAKGTALITSENLLTGQMITERWSGGPPPRRTVESVSKRKTRVEDVK